MVSSMNFQKISGEGLTEPLPQTPAQSRALPSILGRFAPRFGLQLLTPPMFFTPHPTEGYTRSNTVFPNFLHSYITAPNISFQDYVVGLTYTIDKILDGRLGEFLKIQRDECVIPELKYSELLHQVNPFQSKMPQNR